jgi:hypothetical protein
MTTSDRRGGTMALDDIRADLESTERTRTQRKHAFEQLRHRLREQPDDADAKALWARFEGEFGRSAADMPIARDTSGEGFGALSEAEERAKREH